MKLLIIFHLSLTIGHPNPEPCSAFRQTCSLNALVLDRSTTQVSLTISILFTLTFLLLLFVDIMPSTSICLPLLGKYLIFVLLLVVASIAVTCFVLNVHFRSPSTHSMSPWLRRLFLQTLPPYLLISLPKKQLDPRDRTNELKNQKSIFSAFRTAQHSADADDTTKSFDAPAQDRQSPSTADSAGYIYPAELNRAIRNALYISYHLDNESSYQTVRRTKLNLIQLV